ncbi:hypothetical protein HDV57DRAFT_349730 [Trichoderma longibrachiatum]
MSTPTAFSFLPPNADEVIARLQEEAQRQEETHQDEETTPEPEFRNEPGEQEYRWLCQIYHGNFAHDELDELRMGIRDAAYWEREAEYLKRICLDMIRKNRYDRTIRKTDATDTWRNRCLALRQLLEKIGLDTQELYQQRLSITDQHYWKPEVDRLKLILAAREAEIEDRFSTMAAWSHEIPSSSDKGTRLSHDLKRSRKRSNLSGRPQQTPQLRRSARLQSLNASRVEKRKTPRNLLAGHSRQFFSQISRLALLPLSALFPLVLTMAVSVDLSDIVLLIGNVEGTDDILDLSENKRFEYLRPGEVSDTEASWRGGQPSVELTGPFLCFVFGLHMFTPGGWICGSLSDSERCDVQLAENNKSGVSRRHFRIDIHSDTRTKPILLYSAEEVDIDTPVVIELGTVQLRAWRPLLSREQKRRYKRNAQKFHQEYLSALPRSAATTTSLPTLDIRFGLFRNSVYKREGDDLGRGSFASVAKVRELRSGDLFAAKVPYFKASDAPGKARDRWESLSKEFQKLTTLKHAHIVEVIEKSIRRWLSCIPTASHTAI